MSSSDPQNTHRKVWQTAVPILARACSARTRLRHSWPGVVSQGDGLEVGRKLAVGERWLSQMVVIKSDCGLEGGRRL